MKAETNSIKNNVLCEYQPFVLRELGIIGAKKKKSIVFILLYGSVKEQRDVIIE